MKEFKEREKALKMDMTIGGTADRDCYSYHITMNRECTLKEFVNLILTKKEWGNITLVTAKEVIGDLHYKREKIEYSQIDEYMENKIKVLGASGGWTRMDYIVRLGG